MSRACESKFKTRYDWFLHTIEIVNGKSYNTATLSTRLRRVEEFYTTLTEAYEGILTANSDDSVLENYEKKYRQATEIYDQLEAVSASFPNLGGTHVPTESAPAARLPTINLTTFNGDVYSWTSFISLFSSLVLCRRDISKTEKFHYLFSNLVDEPRSLIKHLPMTDESLDTALEILKSRYDNKRLLADAHISRILNIPHVTEITNLRTQVLNPMLESTRALANMSISTDTYIVVHIILSKLPRDIKNRFEQYFIGGKIFDLPTCEQVIQFLQDECRFIDTATITDRVNSDNKCGDRTRRIRNVHTEMVRHDKRCYYCGFENHSLPNCFKFKALLISDRKDFITKNSLCYKCFGKHAAHSCSRNVACNKCSRIGHHTLICMTTNERRASSPRSERPAVMTSSREVARNQRSPVIMSRTYSRRCSDDDRQRGSDEPRKCHDYGRYRNRGKQGDQTSYCNRTHYNSE